MADNRQMIRIRLKAFDHGILDQSTAKIVQTVERTNAKVQGPVPLPTEKHRYTVVRGPHKHKTRASTSKCACTSVSWTSLTTRPRPSTRSSVSTSRPASTSRSRFVKSEHRGPGCLCALGPDGVRLIAQLCGWSEKKDVFSRLRNAEPNHSSAPFGLFDPAGVCVSDEPTCSEIEEEAHVATKAIVGEKVGMTQVWDAQNGRSR